MAETVARLEGIELIAFDLDGTLVDSQRDLAAAVNELLVDCGGSPVAEEAIGRMVGDGAATLVARAFEASGRAAPADALERFLRFYDRRLLATTRPYAGIVEVLRTLSDRYTLAVLTNKPLAETRRILTGLELAPYFAHDLVLGGDGPHARKPDPAGLRALAAAARTTVGRTCLVGDSVVDWQTARAAGASCCLARYGFGFQGVRAESLPPDQPLIDSPAELLLFL